ncbi:MAG: hypothetical protein JXX29_11240 [Deltaproteobacteria bacterium]|nr:hypothetical protein [Deltaproteobacteria bacterium]MBN2672245.1 hypothetical protein [Deltaproteobacteria bacterium]
MNRFFQHSAILAGILVLCSTRAAWAIDFVPFDTDEPWNHHSEHYSELWYELMDSDSLAETVVQTANDHEKIIIGMEQDTDADTSLDPDTVDMPYNWFIPNYAAVLEISYAFESEYPGLVEVIQIGESTDNNPIIAIRIGTDDYFVGDHPNAGELKPVVLFDSGLHGNERESVRIMLDWMDYILNPLNEFDEGTERAAYPGAPAGHTFSTMLDERIIWVVPSVSPDTFNENGGRSKDNGCNPARNFMYDWRHIVDSGVVVSGDYPYSEPEVTALARFAEMIQPEVYLNIHGWRDGIRALNTPNNYNSLSGYWDGTNLTHEIQLSATDTDDTGGNTTTTFLHTTASGDVLPIADNGDVHWMVTQCSGYPGGEIRQYVCRDSFQPGDGDTDYFCDTDESLSGLSDMEQDMNTGTTDYYESVTEHLGPRMYAPYAANDEYVHYENPEWDTMGMGCGGVGQSYSHMNSNLGALSVLYEIQRFDNDSNIWGTGVTSVPTPVLFARKGRRPAPSFIWGAHRDERIIQMLIRDSFYPMNKLVLVADNSVPKPAKVVDGNDYNDLSVSALKMIAPGCSMDFTATYEKTPSNMWEARNGYFGVRDIECTASNIGYTASGAFNIEITVLEDGSFADSSSCPFGSLAAGDSQRCTMLDFDFNKDSEYRVECAVRGGADMETTVGELTDSNDAGCAALFTAAVTATGMSRADFEHAVPNCEWDAVNSNWDGTYFTNNTRYIRFDANLSQYSVCHFDPWDDRIDVNGNVDDADLGFGLDFSVPGNWSSTTAGITSLIDGAEHAIQVDTTGFSFIDSRDFDTSELGMVSDTLVIDVKLPSPLPNPYWKGDMQLAATCSGENMFNVWVGQATFYDLTPGVYEPVAFTFDSDGAHQQLMDVLQQSGHTCSFTFSMTVPHVSSTYYVGNIRFE